MTEANETPNRTDLFTNHPVHIVAIGASAGGLEAIHEFFDNMPDTDQLCFIVIQHLSPDYKSLLVDLVAKHTHMEVIEATHHVLLKPRSVYVIPPGKLITLKNGRLQLENKPKEKAASNVIDTFFISLAAEAASRSVAVILSGTGSDGTRGCHAIKQNGGLVLVQDPITARFDGMPNSAINAGNIDYILAPELMPIQIFDHLKEEIPFSLWDDDRNTEELIEEIFRLLYKHTGCDFQYYKKPTILRRIARRMTQLDSASLEDYLKRLRVDTEENRVLCKEFLIGVTKFFRDKQAFDVIEKEVLAKWAAAASPDQPFKAWVAACSTGNEAYSLAMVVHHYFEKRGITNPIKIFATDIDQAAIDVAARGVYPHTIEQEVPAELLSRYFQREGNEYVVRHDLRKTIVFARHNIISDPPFIRNDLVCCRNMLIYMDVKLQRKVLSTLYFAVNPGAHFWLGPSETASILMENIEETDRKWKIYRKHTDASHSVNPYHPEYQLPGKATKVSAIGRERGAPRNYETHFHRTVAEDFQFAGIYVDKYYVVKEAVGNYLRYLSLPDNGIQLNINKMILPDLAISLNSALRKTQKENKKTAITHIRIKSSETTRSVNLSVYPATPASHGYIFILLSENKYIEFPDGPVADGAAPKPEAANDYIQELKAELHETEFNLQQAIENLEHVNQELQSSNEEMLSANEELQSSNEELQSLNEELHTLNTEHQLKIQELVSLNDDLNNYLRNSEVGQVFLDGNLLIRKFNPVSTKMINLIESDIGRPLAHISNNLKEVNVTAKIEKAARSHETFEREVELTNGTPCLMRIRPYVKQDGGVDGVVLSFVDISAIKELHSMVGATFNSSINPILALKTVRGASGAIEDLEVSAHNQAATFLFGKRQPGANGKLVSELLPCLEKYGLIDRLYAVAETGNSFQSEIFFEEFESWFDLSAVKMWEGLIITFNDITKLKAAESNLKGYLQRLERIKSDLEQSNHDLAQFASVASHDLKEPLRKIQMIIGLLKASPSLAALKEEEKNLTIIYRSADRMRLLIDDLLKFAKLSNEVDYKQLNLNTIIDDCLSDLELTIREKQASISAAPFPLIEGIPQRLRQLFQNLISNALKFSRENAAPEIHIAADRIAHPEFDAPMAGNGRFVRIAFSDNGIGLDEQYAEVAFNMFWKLSNERSGTGIGLAICKKIVEQHNGKIRVRKNKRYGSTFDIILPMKQTPQPATGDLPPPHGATSVDAHRAVQAGNR